MISETDFTFSSLPKHFFSFLHFTSRFLVCTLFFFSFFFLSFAYFFFFICLEFSRNPPKIYMYNLFFFFSHSRFLRAYSLSIYFLSFFLNNFFTLFIYLLIYYYYFFFFGQEEEGNYNFGHRTHHGEKYLQDDYPRSSHETYSIDLLSLVFFSVHPVSGAHGISSSHRDRGAVTGRPNHPQEIYNKFCLSFPSLSPLLFSFSLPPLYFPSPNIISRIQFDTHGKRSHSLASIKIQCTHSTRVYILVVVLRISLHTTISPCVSRNESTSKLVTILL